MSLKPLTDEQLDAAQAWLESLDEGAFDRGSKLFASGAVFNVRNFGRTGIEAAVQGGHRYKTQLEFIDGEWWGDCSCPVTVDCKHCCATMLRALELLDFAGESTGSRTAPDRAAKPPKKTPAVFAGIVEEKLGRKLTSKEKGAASAVDELFEMREAATVPRELVESLSTTGGKGGWNWDDIRLWHTAPATQWDAWLHVAAYFRRAKLVPLDFLAKATEGSEVDAVAAEMQRIESVEIWTRWLTASADAAKPAEVHDLRAKLTDASVLLEWRRNGTGQFKPLSYRAFMQIANSTYDGVLQVAEPSLPVWRAFHTGYSSTVEHPFEQRESQRILNQLLRHPNAADLVVNPDGKPFTFHAGPLAWRVEVRGDTRTDYLLSLTLPDGSVPPPPLVVVDGTPSLYVTSDSVYHGPPLGGLSNVSGQVRIPSEAMETAGGLALFRRLGIEPPERIAKRSRTVALRPVFRCSLETSEWGDTEMLLVTVLAADADGGRDEVYTSEGWKHTGAPPEATKDGTEIVLRDRSALAAVPGLIEDMKLSWTTLSGGAWQKKITSKFPEQFAAWLESLPSSTVIELDPALATLRDPAVVARVTLDVRESGIDWFDIRIALDVGDTTLTKAELKALLDARGRFVRLGKKGWRRLAVTLSEEDEAQLADLGLSARDFSGEPQRLHALQLAGKSAAKKLIAEEQSRAIELRAEQIRTRVQPALPAGIRAELRPYQLAGFHFLAYLTENRFGGILADDMGLGKTLQTLSWLLWLRSEKGATQPALVVCPKSVTDNWRSEAARFAPELAVRVLPTGSDRRTLDAARKDAALVVANYAQLRILADEICAAPWGAVILDEAQAIKNPASSTAKAAWSLKTTHRLALSGTPIENRLLDLWSIMQFAMPGILGSRAAFGKTYDQRGDQLARRRLAARVRPFVIRRTKSEVARDLPARIEEDLLCELEGAQATLYSAELKRARAALLKIGSKAQLDAQRFHILSSLLRLRQICCHPALVGASEKKAAADDGAASAHASAKLSALLDILEPLVAEGHKVLVFSQFVEMLSLIRAELAARGWLHFVLTGGTEDRGALVGEFQAHNGPAVFLISLRAGGFGLNLTSASYVVLFDPWWNPAVENQAIDRTHRIGQVNQVIAYRLIVKDSIEEKIRALQKSKSAMAGDILGEESFARALTLEDFQFLFGADNDAEG